MHKYGVWCLGLLLCAGSFVAAEPQPQQGKLVRETWHSAYLDDAKVGFYRTTVRELERDGQKFLRTTLELNLTIKRFQSTARLRMEMGTDETSDGKVLGVALRQFMGDEQQLLLTGTVEGERLHIKTADGRVDQTVPWNDQVIGLSRQERIFQEKKVKPGQRFSYLSYEPSIASVVKVKAEVKEDPEEVTVLGVKKRLLRAEAVPDKVQGPQGPVTLPSTTFWLNDDLLPLRIQTEMPGLGVVTFYRTTKEAATAPATPGAGSKNDIGLKSLVRLNQIIEHPAATSDVVYRITVKGDDDPASAFAQDNRQKAGAARGNSFDLHVHAVRAPRAVDRPADPGKEYSESCYYLNSDDDKVKEFAQQATGTETDPWEKAQRIERWLYRNVAHDDSVPFAAADKVAANLRGDCRHKAMLGAAMCRAAGVPARTAVGLIYDDDPRLGPVMGFHMWVEVWVKGQWLGIDGTRGLGSVGADHVKIADSSWHDVQSLTPLLPVARVLGKVSIEVVRVNGSD